MEIQKVKIYSLLPLAARPPVRVNIFNSLANSLGNVTCSIGLLFGPMFSDIGPQSAMIANRASSHGGS